MNINKCKKLHEAFEFCAKKFSCKIAAKMHNQIISYKELDQASSNLANFLNDKIKGNFVGICIENHIDIIIAILAILKSNKAYVPIDPHYPQDRINYIIQDADLEYVLTNQATLSTFLQSKINDENNRKLIAIDDLDTFQELVSNNAIEYNPDYANVAYIIYTSGSTGNPKGVIIEHANVLNYATWVENYLSLTSSDIIDCSSSYAFDLTITVSLLPLLFGATISLCPLSTKENPQEYLNYLQKENISVIKLTPSYFNLLNNINKSNTSLIRLKSIILGGENISIMHVKKWLEKYPNQKIINEYGPTETTVGVTQYTVDQSNIKQYDFIPLGTPGNNMDIFILNENNEMAMPGEMGEIYIGGACLALGYLNLPKMTKEKFIDANIFNLLNQDGGRYCGKLYKTGDLVKVHKDDQLEYVGRADNQVKIRGYRIEIGEIENALMSYEGISQAAVVAKKNDVSNYLVAYYSPRLKNVTKNDIKAYLLKKLPEYMIPNIFIVHYDFSLTINGKLNKSLLPDIKKYLEEISDIDKNRNVTSRIASVWKKIIQIENIDSDANFFDSGADSLSIVKFHSDLLDAGFDVSLMDLFQHTSINALSSFLNPVNRSSEIKIRNRRDFIINRRIHVS